MGPWSGWLLDPLQIKEMKESPDHVLRGTRGAGIGDPEEPGSSNSDILLIA